MSDEKRFDYPDILTELKTLRSNLADMQKEFRLLFYGENGDPTRPGIVVRLDRLEQRARGNTTLIYSLWTVVGGILVELVSRLVGKHL